MTNWEATANMADDNGVGGGVMSSNICRHIGVYLIRQTPASGDQAKGPVQWLERGFAGTAVQVHCMPQTGPIARACQSTQSRLVVFALSPWRWRNGERRTVITISITPLSCSSAQNSVVAHPKHRGQVRQVRPSECEGPHLLAWWLSSTA